METRNIQIDLTTAQTWYKQGGNLKELALQAFSENELISQLPQSYLEYLNTAKPKEIWRTAIPCATIEQATQFEILCKLIRIKDYYNQGWKPNWCNDDEDKYCIVSHKNNLKAITSWQTNYLFAFKTRELRGEFLQNFEKDLKTIQEFL